MTFDTENSCRIDKWLWASRLFRTRTLAATAVRGGKVRVNGLSVKPARMIRAGDSIALWRGGQQMTVTVIAVMEQRISAKDVPLVYAETVTSVRQREQAARDRRLNAIPLERRRSRPTKKDRRALLRLKKNSTEATDPVD